MPQWLVTISPLLNLVAVLALLYLIYEYRFPLQRRLERVDDRVSRIEERVSRLELLAMGMLSPMGSLVAALHQRAALTPEEFRDIQGAYQELAKAGLRGSLRQFGAGGNPLSKEEAQRLESYVAKAERADSFSPDEVEDYQALVAKIEKEHPGDPALFPLKALGAFLSGLYLWPKKRQEASR